IPASKKSSPSLDTVSDGETGHTLSSQIYTSRRTRSQSGTPHTQPLQPPPLASPQHFLQSPKNKGYQDSSHATPRAKRRQETSESLQQHSPDMPFLSSQLCSTQDCEVVWNCDSPGFSKDDLKRLHGDQTESNVGGCSLSPLEKSSSVPNRALFSWARNKPTNTTSAGISKTTSQLNQLLDQLCKSKDEETKAPDSMNLMELPESHNEYSSSTQNSTLSSSPLLPKLLLAPSSQPFTVFEKPCSVKSGNNFAPVEDALDVHGSVDDSVWDDELNLGICDISGIDLASDQNKKTLVKETDSSVITFNKLEPTDAAVDIICESSDVFDDDLFNESVIRTTQAVEEALVELNELQDPIKSEGISECILNNKFDKNNIMPQTSVRINARLSEQCTEEPTTSCRNDCELKDNFFISSCDTSAVLRKCQTSSEKPPQRQVRNSFRLGLYVHSYQKENVLSIQSCQKTNNDISVNTGYSINSNLKINPVISKQQAQSTCAQTRSLKNIVRIPTKTSYSSSIGTKRNSLSKTSLYMEDGSSGKSLSRKGPILRSQSTGNAKITDTVEQARRSNSCAEIDTTREFEEDDEIFKSLLSVLPEDDKLLEGQILQPQVIMASHKLANVKENAKYLESSTIFTEKSSLYLPMETEKKDAIQVDQKELLGIVTRKSSNLEYTGVIRGRTNQKRENRDTTSNWTPRLKSGMKEDGGKQACASRTCNIDETPAQLQTSDMLDDDLFEDDVLTLIDEVESQYGSQQPHSGPSSSQPSQSQLVQCTQDEIARKKEAARRLREERKQQRHCSSQYHSVW
ncbi:hypothetical protein Pcinc_005235, partial [Petrolisthes cinctipes]